MKGGELVGSPSGIVAWPLTSASVGSGGILKVVRQLNVKEAPVGRETSPDGTRKTSGTG